MSYFNVFGVVLLLKLTNNIWYSGIYFNADIKLIDLPEPAGPPKING